jgi:hypothetical protein
MHNFADASFRYQMMEETMQINVADLLLNNSHLVFLQFINWSNNFSRKINKETDKYCPFDPFPPIHV